MTKLIAEIGQAHDGSLGMCHSYIDALAKTGVNAIKFQTHIAHAESSIHEPFRIKFSKQDATRYDYWKRMEFSQAQWIDIGKHCKDVDIEFISSPFSNTAVDVLEVANVQCYKVGSGEVTNFLLLKKIAETKKPAIISSGMSSLKELDASIAFLKALNVDVSLLQCTTSYPTQPEQYGLNMIAELRKRYHIPIGFSDHSARIETGIAAVTLGAEILEFHAVFSKDQFGPDVSSSLTISEITELVKGVRHIETALKHPVYKTDNSSFKDLKKIFEKSLAVNKDLKKGHILTFDDLEAKKPKGFGISATHFEKVIGQALTCDLKAYNFLTEDDIS